MMAEFSGRSSVHARTIQGCGSRFRRQILSHAAPRGNPEVIALGNICLDIFSEVPVLPSSDLEVRRRLLDELTRSPPGEESWEVGGNCNFMIAAARLGLSVGSLGHVGNDVYGQYVDRILQVCALFALLVCMWSMSCSGPCTCPMLRCIQQGENVEHNQELLGLSPDQALNNTLVCFVLVDPNSRHAFCSRYDFGPWPLLQGIATLPEHSIQVCGKHVGTIDGYMHCNFSLPFSD